MGKPLPPTYAGETDAECRQACERLRTQLLSDRMSSWDPHWRQIADVMLPRHQRFLGDAAAQANIAGRRVDQFIVDSTATSALRTLSAGMMSGLTSPSRPWFALTTDDPDVADNKDARSWLSDVEAIVRAVFLKSNFYNTLPQAYLDLGAFGVSAFELLEDDEDQIRCYAYPIGSYALASSARNVVDTLVREFPQTVRQCVERWGLDRCSVSVKTMWENGSRETRINVVHVVRRNPGYKPGSDHPLERKWSSVYYEQNLTNPDEAGLFFEKSGFYEFPLIAPRWGTVGEDVYGWSPGMDALGYVRELQTNKRRHAEAVYKMVTPPLIGPASLANKAIRNVPGGVTFADTQNERDGLRPLYDVNLRIDHLQAYMVENKQAVQHIFYEDLFRTFSMLDGKMTAEEVRARKTEEVQALGPVVDRLLIELCDTSVTRTLAILGRRRMLPPPPQALRGKTFKIEYISTMAQIQRAASLSSTQQFVVGVMQMAQLFPEAPDKLNVDEVIDDSAEALGVSPKLLRSDDEVKAIRDNRAKQQQAQQAQQALLNGAKSAKDLGQVDLSGNNPVSQMLPGAGQQSGIPA